MRRKILIVDDEQNVRAYLSYFFRERGFDVSAAGSGEEALKRINEEAPDIMLLDVRMSGMGGLEVLKHVKQLHPKVQVVMLTGVETDDAVNEALRIGAAAYVKKPLVLKELQDLVRNLSESHGEGLA